MIFLSMVSSYEERKQKWEKGRKHDLNSIKKATYFLTVKNTLSLLEDKKDGLALDIGCGFGDIDIMLAKNTKFKIIGCDIAENVVKIAKSNIEVAGLGNRITIEEGDVYRLKYPDNYFDIILSFGYVSAATHPGVQKEVSRILKPGGILICDFINCLSLYKFLGTIKRIISGKGPYYLVLKGIQREFEKAGLFYIDQRLFNTYPPLNLKMNPKIFILFEETFGRIFKNILARVRLIKFQKK